MRRSWRRELKAVSQWLPISLLRGGCYVDESSCIHICSHLAGIPSKSTPLQPKRESVSLHLQVQKKKMKRLLTSTTVITYHLIFQVTLGAFVRPSMCRFLKIQLRVTIIASVIFFRDSLHHLVAPLLPLEERGTTVRTTATVFA